MGLVVRVDGATGYFNYEISNQGFVETAGDDREHYSTSVVTEESQRFIREEAENPFFLWMSYLAPHVRNSKESHCERDAPTPLPGDWREFRNAHVELSDSFDEANVSDKPQQVRRREPLGRDYVALAKERIRCTFAAMQEVDSGVHDIRQMLREQGIDDNTVLIYVSDNGYFFGEHRIAKGKSLPYVETVRVPMIVHVPHKVLGRTSLASTNPSRTSTSRRRSSSSRAPSRVLRAETADSWTAARSWI